MNARNFLRYWLPVLVWMGLIFWASCDSGSFRHTSRIVEPFLHWLLPNISDEAVHLTIVGVRKAGHVTEYAILAWLIWRLVRHHRKAPPVWRWSDAGLALRIVVLYAASDEFHQRFVPSRGASVHDVLIDSGGGLLALLCLWAFAPYRHRSSKLSETPAPSDPLAGS